MPPGTAPVEVEPTPIAVTAAFAAAPAIALVCAVAAATPAAAPACAAAYPQTAPRTPIALPANALDAQLSCYTLASFLDKALSAQGDAYVGDLARYGAMRRSLDGFFVEHACSYHSTI